MASAQVVLVVPPTNGVGASSDISLFDTEKSIVVDSSLSPTEILTIEASADPVGTPDAARTWNGVTSFTNNYPGPQTLNFQATAVRVRRQFVTAGFNPSVTVGSTTNGTNTQFTLVVPTPALGTSGVGPSLDVSAGGPQTSFYLGGIFGGGTTEVREQIVIEGSQDAASWNGIIAFTALPELNLLTLTYKFLRARRINSSGTPFVCFLQTALSGGGGSATGDFLVIGKFSGLLGQGEGAVFTFLADIGNGEAVLPTNNQVDPSLYPTSARTITRLRACAPLGIPNLGGAGIPVTLYKNGVATTMTCTIPDNSPFGTTAFDIAHPITFADGDKYDVRVDGVALPSNIAVTAQLEGPASGGIGSFPGFAPANQPVGALVGGVAATAARSDHQHPTLLFAGIATGVTQLSTFASLVYTEGAKAWVESVGAWFDLRPSILTVDNITVVAATGKAGFQWLRMMDMNPVWAAQVAWFIDPVAGSDESVGNTAATAIKTLAELSRRWWNATIKATSTWTIVDNVPTSDTPNWTFRTLAPNTGNITLTITGILGATTGFGGRAIDNTLYAGSVTAFVPAADGPNADDIEMTDAAVPVSFTAAGLMGSGIIINTTSGTSKFFYLLKDLGAQTARITAPQQNPINSSTWSLCTLTVGQTYKAYQLRTFPAQNWGNANSGRQLHINTTLLYDNSTSTPDDAQGVTWAIRRVLCWIGPKPRIIFVSDNNVLQEVTSGAGPIAVPVGKVPPQINGGGFRCSVAGTNTQISYFGQMGFGAGPVTFQGVGFQTNDNAYCTIETPIAIHDTNFASGNGAILATSASRVQFNLLTVGAGLSGKGNTGKLLCVNLLSNIGYSFNSAAPPLVAGSSTDASPVQIDAVAYAVAAIPAANNTNLRSGTVFP